MCCIAALTTNIISIHSESGYKLRVHINKALKTRCKAIRAALRKYNEAAKALDRPQLDWKDLTNYESLAEFDLLKECRDDIRQQPWADARNRQATLHLLKLERANEERNRLNIEIARLVDWMDREEGQLSSAIKRLHAEPESSESLFATEVDEMLALRRRQNTIHRVRIQKIYDLPYYTGVQDHRIAFGNTGLRDVDGDTQDCQDIGEQNIETMETDGAEEDDAVGDELDRLNDFLTNLSHGLVDAL